MPLSHLLKCAPLLSREKCINFMFFVLSDTSLRSRRLTRFQRRFVLSQEAAGHREESVARMRRLQTVKKDLFLLFCMPGRGFSSWFSIQRDFSLILCIVRCAQRHDGFIRRSARALCAYF